MKGILYSWLEYNRESKRRLCSRPELLHRPHETTQGSGHARHFSKYDRQCLGRPICSSDRTTTVLTRNNVVPRLQNESSHLGSRELSSNIYIHLGSSTPNPHPSLAQLSQLLIYYPLPTTNNPPANPRYPTYLSTTPDYVFFRNHPDPHPCLPHLLRHRPSSLEGSP
jgi:hypothetical protein